MDDDPNGAEPAAPPRPARIAVLLYHHVHEHEAAALVGALGMAAREAAPDGPEGAAEPGAADGADGDDGAPPPLEVTTVARARHSVQTSGGMTVTPAWGFPGAPAFDAIVVPGGPGLDRAARDKATVTWLAGRAAASPRPLLACSGGGALLLGAAGLLRGARVAAHPDALARLDDFEVASAAPDALLRDDEAGVWSAGPMAGAAGLGLALAGRWLGRGAVERAARRMGLEPPPP